MYLSEISPAHLRGAVCGFSPVFVRMYGYNFFLLRTGRNRLPAGCDNIDFGLSNLGHGLGYGHEISLADAARPDDRSNPVPVRDVAAMSGVAQIRPAQPGQRDRSPKRYLIRSVYFQRDNLQFDSKGLTWLRGTLEVHDEMDEMRAESEAMKLVPKTTLREMFTNPSLRSPLIIAVMMMLAQQLSGINAVIYFSTDIFKSAGLSTETSQYATLGMGGMNVLMTIVSLILIERAGRKTLMLVGLIGMLIDVILLTICLYFKVKSLSSTKFRFRRKFVASSFNVFVSIVST